MKVIDLLNKIANGEAPKNIKYDNKEYYLYNDKVYITTDKSKFFDRIQFGELDNEVEIIEEDKKIEKIDQNDREWHYLHNTKKTTEEVADNLEHLRQKVNEIIDCLEEKQC